ncbi:response regulator [Herbaspirillum sp. ST 5-3]|uniref:response regulator n=1 Tax=Oxalobacteraceae TaxID=75682 RepID=UPI0010A35ED5|nr:response regulator [Herbaspirillum sp. ST 5-3]
MTTTSFQVLVVEDNSDFLQILCEMLETLGHRPHGVSNAEDAVAWLGTQPFDVLIADVQLPGMSGIDLAKIVARKAPEVRIVFSSGFGYLLTDKLDFNFVVLHKPYFLNQLKHAVEHNDSERRTVRQQ